MEKMRVDLKGCSSDEAIEESTAMLDALMADSIDRWEAVLREHGADEDEIEIELARYAAEMETERARTLAKLRSWLRQAELQIRALH